MWIDSMSTLSYNAVFRCYPSYLYKVSILLPMFLPVVQWQLESNEELSHLSCIPQYVMFEFYPGLVLGWYCDSDINRGGTVLGAKFQETIVLLFKGIVKLQICGLAKLRNHPNLSFTVHSINKSWDLNSYCLDTVPIFEDHTGQNLADAIQDIHANWELKPEDLVRTTTENGSNFIAAFNAWLA